MYLHSHSGKRGDKNISFIRIPRQIIYDLRLSNRRAVTYAYFFMRRGLDDIVGFSINDIVLWQQLKPDSHKNKINQKTIIDIQDLANSGFLVLRSPIQESTKFYSAKFLESNESEYAEISVEECQRIFNYRCSNNINAADIILLLAYIRINMKIGFNYEHYYSTYYNLIAGNIGISCEYAEKIIAALNDLEILDVKVKPNYKYDTISGTKWMTGKKIIKNAAISNK